MGKLLLVAVGLGILASTWWWSVTRPPKGLGLENGRLPACPSSPNCVCSEDSVNGTIEPFIVTGEKDPLVLLEEILEKDPNASLVTRSNQYLHAEFRTPWLRFTDDFEARFDRESGVLHFRSASRVGYSDLGTNRRRVESIRRRLELELSQD